MDSCISMIYMNACECMHMDSLVLYFGVSKGMVEANLSLDTKSAHEMHYFLCAYILF